MRLVVCTPIDTTSYSTLHLYSLLFIGLLQKTLMMSRSESDLSTSEDEHEDTTENGIPVSATQGDGVDVLWDRI